MARRCRRRTCAPSPTSRPAAPGCYVGGTVGILAVLHTWTQQLHYHPHVHCLVTGGGIADDGKHWYPARKSFLVPMKALAKLVRGKLRAAFEKRRPDLLIPDATWSKPWVTQCTPWGEGEQGVLDYLARYVFRVAITNARIVGLDDRTVTIRCKDRRLNQWRTSRMPGDEFMRRFLQHVLPKGLHKVRYFGLWHPSHREQAARVRQLLWLDRLQPAGSKAARMPMARHSMARHSMARSPTNLAFVRIVEWGICCRSATLRRDGRKGHDIPR